MNLITRYLSGKYLSENPTWDIEDSPWKAAKVAETILAAQLSPKSICEVGCGAGGILAELRTTFPRTALFGFDIAPDAAQFWPRHSSTKIKFCLGDFFELNQRHYELILLLDVIEHISDPFDFLVRLRSHADYFLFHIPLDLSAINILREKPLLGVRHKVGHINYYTKGLALAFLQECDYEVIDWHYTGVAFSGPKRSRKSRLAALPRCLAYAIHKDVGVRLLGGETLIVFARPRI